MWWIFGALVVVVGGAVLVARLSRVGTLYFAWSGGFLALPSSNATGPRTTDREGVARAIYVLLRRDRYDSLTIGVDEDFERSLGIWYWNEPLSIDFSFTIATEAAEEAWVRAYFADRGVPCESNDFNVGMGPKNEARSLDFPVGAEADLATMTFEILDGLYGPTEDYHVSASATQDGPGDGSGLKWCRHRDRLEGVL